MSNVMHFFYGWWLWFCFVNIKNEFWAVIIYGVIRTLRQIHSFISRDLCVSLIQHTIINTEIINKEHKQELKKLAFFDEAFVFAQVTFNFVSNIVLYKVVKVLRDCIHFERLEIEVKSFDLLSNISISEFHQPWEVANKAFLLQLLEFHDIRSICEQSALLNGWKLEQL